MGRGRKLSYQLAIKMYPFYISHSTLPESHSTPPESHERNSTLKMKCGHVKHISVTLEAEVDKLPLKKKFFFSFSGRIQTAKACNHVGKFYANQFINEISRRQST